MLERIVCFVNVYAKLIVFAVQNGARSETERVSQVPATLHALAHTNKSRRSRSGIRPYWAGRIPREFPEPLAIIVGFIHN